MNINTAVIKMQGRSRMDAVPPERGAARAGGAAPRPRPGRGHLRPGSRRPRALGRAVRQAAFPEPPSCAAADVRGSKLSASRPAASSPESSPPPEPWPATCLCRARLRWPRLTSGPGRRAAQLGRCHPGGPRGGRAPALLGSNATPGCLTPEPGLSVPGEL